MCDCSVHRSAYRDADAGRTAKVGACSVAMLLAVSVLDGPAWFRGTVHLVFVFQGFCDVYWWCEECFMVVLLLYRHWSGV